MNQPITLARELTFGEYVSYVEGCAASSNAAAGDTDEMEPPSIEWWNEQQERIMNTPELTGVGHA